MKHIPLSHTSLLLLFLKWTSFPSPLKILEMIHPKRPRTTKGTTVMIPKDILSKLGPTADRLNLSGTQLAGIVAAVTNHRHPLSRRTSTVTWGRLTLMGSFCQDSEGLEKSTDWLSFSIRQVFYKFNKRTNFQSAQFQFYKTIVII